MSEYNIAGQAWPEVTLRSQDNTSHNRKKNRPAHGSLPAGRSFFPKIDNITVPQKICRTSFTKELVPYFRLSPTGQDKMHIAIFSILTMQRTDL